MQFLLYVTLWSMVFIVPFVVYKLTFSLIISYYSRRRVFRRPSFTPPQTPIHAETGEKVRVPA